MNIYNQLMEIAAEVLEKPVDELSPDLPIEEQGADSLHIA
ncbi:MAG: acyl carrier protein, partial [Clostridia bacterium]|nr:acyl carrier protein [Clostridia bacterium]